MPCHPHESRRTFALWCSRDGRELDSLRLLMGHSSRVFCRDTWRWQGRK
jgi:integrase